MGFTSPIEEQYNNLYRLRNQLFLNQKINEVKLETSKNKISDIGKSIEQGNNEIKQFCHCLTKEELEIKAKQLMMLQRDLELETKNFDAILNYNNLLKNNIYEIENNMNELIILKNTKDINKEFKKMELINTYATLSENANILLNQKERENNIIKKLENIDEIYNWNKKTPEQYLKEILSNTKIEKNIGFL